ncbi:hypothetical protein AB0B45_50595 [Nonomuraea sp. NPDC049152]|uniref:hypothetical protein n=1 Tax=Nonomuraea sp. NPDC049152 TaxID=3154350 RepID=UPI003401699D
MPAHLGTQQGLLGEKTRTMLAAARAYVDQHDELKRAEPLWPGPPPEGGPGLTGSARNLTRLCFSSRPPLARLKGMTSALIVIDAQNSFLELPGWQHTSQPDLVPPGQPPGRRQERRRHSRVGARLAPWVRALGAVSERLRLPSWVHIGGGDKRLRLPRCSART